MNTKFYLVAIFALLFSLVGCTTDPADDDDKKCGTCGDWQECNTKTGSCDAKAGFCNTKDECSTGQVCDETSHTCKTEVQTACTGQTCSDHGTCNVVNNKAVCTCDEGYLVSTDKLSCVEDSICDGITCSDHGTCSVNSQGQAVCDCDDGYQNDSNNALYCVLSGECSVANPNGTCDQCLTCQGGTCVPDGGRACDGGYNHRCDPDNENANGDNLDCDSGLCFYVGEKSFETGYCSMFDCVTDSDCDDPNTDELFICIKYGAQYRGICQKVEPGCDAVNRDGETFSDCSDACGDANCKQADLCISGSCAPECMGPNDTRTCGMENVCLNINSSDFPLYRCVDADLVAGYGEDCSDKSCGNGLICLTYTAEGDAACFQECASDADCDGTTCTVYPSFGFCEAPKNVDPWELCDMFNDCKDGASCLNAGGDGYCIPQCTLNSDDCDAWGTECANYGAVGNFCESPQDRQAGEACNLAHECVDGASCLTAGNQSFCFQECTMDGTECDALGTECETVGTVGNFCAAPQNGELGDDCNIANECMDSLICVSFGDVLSLCLESCTPGSTACECQDLGEGAGACMPECLSDEDCEGTDVCLPETLTCGQAAPECTVATEVTDCIEGNLGYCLEDTQNSANNVCVECINDDHCADGYECSANACQVIVTPPACTVETEVTDCTIGTELHCLVDAQNSTNNVCVECASDTHCAENTTGTHCFLEPTNFVDGHSCGCQTDDDCEGSAVCTENVCGLKK
ncbi:hypothetical protein JXR93_09800 [bacterium]|nr:hypothetical protein [bacterium]